MTAGFSKIHNAQRCRIESVGLTFLILFIAVSSLAAQTNASDAGAVNSGSSPIIDPWKASRSSRPLIVKDAEGNATSSEIQAGNWFAIGPFNNVSTLTPEDLWEGPGTISHSGSIQDGTETRVWLETKEWNDDSEIHDFFRTVTPRKNDIFYFVDRILKAPRDTDAYLYFSSDDYLEIYQNGGLLYKDEIGKGSVSKSDFRKIKLLKGENEFLLKVTNLGWDFNFYFEIAPIADPGAETSDLIRVMEGFPDRGSVEEARELLNIMKTGDFTNPRFYFGPDMLRLTFISPKADAGKAIMNLKFDLPGSVSRDLWRKRLLHIYRQAGIWDQAFRRFSKLAAGTDEKPPAQTTINSAGGSSVAPLIETGPWCVLGPLPLASGFKSGDILAFSPSGNANGVAATDTKSPVTGSQTTGHNKQEFSFYPDMSRIFTGYGISLGWYCFFDWNNDREQHFFPDPELAHESPSIYFACREIRSSADAEAYLYFSSNNFMEVFINGEEIFGGKFNADHVSGMNFRRVKLRKGKNYLLVRVQKLRGDCFFQSTLSVIANPSEEIQELLAAMKLFPGIDSPMEAGALLEVMRQNDLSDWTLPPDSRIFEQQITSPAEEIRKLQEILKSDQTESIDSNLVRLRLLQVLRETGILDQARLYYSGILSSREIILQPWWVLGPFNIGSEPSIIDLGNQSRRICLEKTLGDDRQKFGWQMARGWSDDRENHNLFDLFSFPRDKAMVYAFRRIIASKISEAYVYFGADDFLEIYLNGKQVYRDFCDKGSFLRSDFRKVRLEKGANDFLVKIGNFGGSYSFNCEICPVSDPGKERAGLTEAVKRFPPAKNAREAGILWLLLNKGSLPEADEYLKNGFLQTPIVNPVSEILRIQKIIIGELPGPENKEISRLRLLDLYRNTGVTDIARRHLLTIVKNNRKAAAKLFRQGIGIFFSGELLPASRYFEKSLDLYPGYFPASLYNIKALYHLFLKTEDNDFFVRFRKSIPIARGFFPNSAELSLLDACFKKANGEFPEALKALLEARLQRPEFHEAEFFLPDLEGNLGGTAAKNKALEKLIELNKEATRKLIGHIEE